MSSECYSYNCSDYLSDSSIQINETGLCSLDSVGYYPQVNLMNSSTNTSSEACSPKICSEPYRYSVSSTDFNQDTLIDVAMVAKQTSSVPHEDLNFLFLQNMKSSFPNVFSFHKHALFELFSKTWIDFNYNLLLQSDPTCMTRISQWFDATILKVPQILVEITQSKSYNESPDAQSGELILAFEQLGDQIRDARKIMQSIEESRVLLNKDPILAEMPFIEDTCLTGLNSVLCNQTQMCQQTGYDSSRNDIQYGLDLNFSSNEVSDYSSHNPNLLLASNNIGYPVNILDISPTESHVSTPTALYIPHFIPNNTATESESVFQVDERYFEKYFKPNNYESALFPHVHPSWLHSSTSWLDPLIKTEEINNNKSMSLPASPTWKSEIKNFQEPMQEEYGSISCTTFPTSTNEPIVYSQESYDISLFLSRSNSPVSNYSYEFLLGENESNSLRASTVEGSDYEYKNEEMIEEEYKQLEERRQPKMTKVTQSGRYIENESVPSSLFLATTERNKSFPAISKNLTTNKRRSYTRRTATSYDSQTTLYLKTVFFDIYSQQDKLTKDQRREVQRVTGLKPRNITYWFSNHKRRFRDTLKKFKEAREKNKGKINTYEDFIKWRSSQGLPEEVHSSECTVSNK